MSKSLQAPAPCWCKSWEVSSHVHLSDFMMKCSRKSSVRAKQIEREMQYKCWMHLQSSLFLPICYLPSTYSLLLSFVISLHPSLHTSQFGLLPLCPTHTHSLSDNREEAWAQSKSHYSRQPTQHGPSYLWLPPARCYAYFFSLNSHPTLFSVFSYTVHYQFIPFVLMALQHYQLRTNNQLHKM